MMGLMAIVYVCAHIYVKTSARETRHQCPVLCCPVFRHFKVAGHPWVEYPWILLAAHCLTLTQYWPPAAMQGGSWVQQSVSGPGQNLRSTLIKAWRHGLLVMARRIVLDVTFELDVKSHPFGVSPIHETPPAHMGP